MRHAVRALAALLPLLLMLALAARAQPLQIDVAGAGFEPIPIALLPFEATEPDLAPTAADIGGVIRANLVGSGLFRLTDPAAFIDREVPFDTAPTYANWRTIGSDALVTGRVQRSADGRLQVQFRVFDTAGERQIAGVQLLAAAEDWRRVAHKVSDGVYTALTGEGPYFDSQIAFIDETGPKGDRRKRLAVMDQDGANLRYLPGADGLVLTPRISPDNELVLYIAYDDGAPAVMLQRLDGGGRERLGNFPGMTFAPRFSPDGAEVILSLAEGGNTDLYALRLADRQLRRLTNTPAIETAADYSPDGRQIVFESDRGGSQQLYVMSASGGPARRISFGPGRYGTPVWSPRGDLIAFTNIRDGAFHIGVMRADGTQERLLDRGFLVEGPSFSPNGRVLVYYTETPGQQGRASLATIDVTGRNRQRLATPNAASDPSWSPLRE